METVTLQGSPPRMRGKEGGEMFMSVMPGITPAHAGKRFKRKCPRLRGEDHPRACGEK